MLKIDAQVHIWLTDRPSRPWDKGYRERYRDKPSFLQHAGQSNDAENVLAEMAEVGVSGAVLTTLGVYGDNNAFEHAATKRYPEHFRTVGVVNHLAPDLEEQLARQIEQGLVGIRIPGLREASAFQSGAHDRLLRACNDLRLAVMLPSINSALAEHLPRYPNAFFFLNHLGLGSAPPIVGYRDAKPFATLCSVLELSSIRNLGLKLTGVPALSVEPYPFRDIWRPVRKVISSFGADRVTWGADYTRTSGLHSYWEAAHYLELVPEISDDELELIYGKTLMDRLRWNRWTVPSAPITDGRAETRGD